MMLSGNAYDELERELLGALVYDYDHQCRPRGQLVREKLAVTLRLSDPRARLSASPARAANYGFAAGEFLWYLRGADDLETIAYYNKRMADFSNDGVTVNSAYGRRLRVDVPDQSGKTQWANVVEELKKDPDSRRAVMTVFSPGDLEDAVARGSKDVPCTMALQFFIRDQRLHLHVTMRSNDAVWGLCNDLFSFTLLQEVMLLDLRQYHPGLEIGEYLHTAGSMHLYEKHFELAKRVASEPARERRLSRMPPIADRAELTLLLAEEKSIRERGESELDFRHGAAWLLDRLREHKKKREKEEEAARCEATTAT